MRLIKKLSVFLFTCLALNGFAQEYVEGQLYFKLKNEVKFELSYPESSDRNPKGLNEVFARYSVISCKHAFNFDDEKLKRTYLLTFNKSVNRKELIEVLQSLDYIEYAESIPIYEHFLTPNDLHANQYNLDLIKAADAWDIGTGIANVKVAVIDDGFLLTHEDLAPVVWTNPNEIPGNNIDDDGNGYIDDVNGWDAGMNDNNPGVTAGATNFGHGTHCAGIAVAATDNNKGIASISYNVSFIPIKISDNNASLVGSVPGITYAIEEGADVISMSYGGPRNASSPTFMTEQNLIDYGHSQGVVFVAAAGNSGNTDLKYPASYNHVISVGATNQADLPASFTTYNSAVDVMAPGYSIYSCLVDNNTAYGNKNGTSMACPLVAGLAGFLKSINPNLTPDEIEACIKNNADAISGTDPKYNGNIGTGRINAFESAKCVAKIWAEFSADELIICPGDSVQFTDLSHPNITSWKWTFTGGSPSTSTLQNPKVHFPSLGTHTVKLVVTNAQGIDSVEIVDYVEAIVPTAKISGNTTIEQGASANIKLELAGKLPLNVLINDGSASFLIENIDKAVYYFNVFPSGTTKYFIDSVYTKDGCSGTFSDTATITVIPPAPPCWTIDTYQKISNLEGNFTATLNNVDRFGGEIAEIGDLDDDGIPDIAVSAMYDNDGGSMRGAVYILFMNRNGTVKDHQKISDLAGGFTATFADVDQFGKGLSGLGDLDGDGVEDIVVGYNNKSSASKGGGVYILFLNKDGTVKSHTIIASGTTNFTSLTSDNSFGLAIDNIGDLDDDGVTDIVVGDYLDDSLSANGGYDKGAVYVIFLNSNGTCKGYTKVGEGFSGFTGSVYRSSLFGNGATGLGDLDGDGVEDIAVGAARANDGGPDRGEVWILFMNTNGTVKTYTKISATTIGFTGVLKDSDHFGMDIDCVGDMNNDGVQDILVGAHLDDDFANKSGAAYIVYLDKTGGVKGHKKITTNQARFTEELDEQDWFGFGVSSVGDIDNDGIVDIGITAMQDDDGGQGRGAAYILFGKDSCLERNINLNCLTTGYYRKISDIQGNFTATLDNSDQFGRSIGRIGDLDGDGVVDMVVGANQDSDNGGSSGAIYILFMNPDGTVKSHKKITEGQSGFTGNLNAGDQFGCSVEGIGDIDKDGVMDIGVGAQFDDDGGADRGAVYILFMNTDGTVKSHQKLSSTSGNFPSVLDDQDRLGLGIVSLGDLNGDGNLDIGAAAVYDGDGAYRAGAYYVLFLDQTGKVTGHQKISNTQGSFTGTIVNSAVFGTDATNLGDLDGDGVIDIAVTAPWDNDGATNSGAVYILFLNNDGTVKAHQKISNTQGGLNSTLAASVLFGYGITNLGDLDNDGNNDIGVGTIVDNTGGSARGAYYILNLLPSGKVKSERKFSSSSGVIAGSLDNDDSFGTSLSLVGDVNGDGIEDYAVGSLRDDDGGTNRGAVYLFMVEDSCANDFDNCNFVYQEERISDTEGGFTASFVDDDRFGADVDSIGDLDGDGVQDVIVAALGLHNERGGFYVLFLNSDGSVKSYKEISGGVNGFTATFSAGDRFGSFISSAGDLDGDGVQDVLASADQDDLGGVDRGAMYILFMKTDGTVKSHKVIAHNTNGGPSLSNYDRFGGSPGVIGDLNNDGITDLAVGAFWDGSAGYRRGAVYILFMKSNGTVDSYKKIYTNNNGFTGVTSQHGLFGAEVEGIGDLDGDGVPDLAVGEWAGDDNGADVGIVWILFMNADGTVKTHSRISKTTGNFEGVLNNDDRFGRSISALGDVNADGVNDILVSSDKDDNNSTGSNKGAIYTIYLYPNGTVKDYEKVSSIDGNFGGTLINNAIFGSGVTSLGDLNKDGFVDFAVGSQHNADGGYRRGAVWILFMRDSCTEYPCSVKADFSTIGECVDQDITITDLSLDTLYRSKIVTREWDFGDNSTIVYGDSIVVHNFDDKDTFEVKLIITNDELPKCTDTVTKLLPIGGFRVSSLTDSATICIGDSADISGFSIKCGFGDITYSWSPSIGINDSSKLSIKAAPTSTTTYTLTAIDEDNDTAYFDYVVVIDSSCCRSVAKIAAPETVCLLDTVTLGNISLSASNATVDWYFDAGTSISSYSGDIPVGVYFTTKGYHTIKLVISDTCSTDSTEVLVYVSGLPNVFAGRDTALCLNDTITIGDTLGLSDMIYEWIPSVGLDNDKIYNPRTFAESTQEYVLKVRDRVSGCINKDTIKVIRSIVPDTLLPSDTFICELDTLQIDAGMGHSGYIYQWSYNSMDSLAELTTADTFWLEVTDTIGCKNRDTIVLDIKTLPIFSLGIDTALCPDDSILIAVDSMPGWSFNWQDNSKDSSIMANIKGTYWLEVTDSFGCVYRDSLELDIYSPFNLELGADTAICDNTSVTIDAGVGGAGWTYNWSNSTSSKTTTISSDKTIHVTVTSPNGCVERDTISVSIRTKPSVELQDDTAICIDEDIVIGKDRGPGWTYFWSDNSATATITADVGSYWLEVTDTAGCKNRDTIVIAPIQYPDITGLVDEEFLCQNDSVKLSAPSKSEYTYRWTREPSGQLLSSDSVYTTKQPGTFRITISNKGCDVSDTVVISRIISPTVNLGLDTVICEDEEYILRTAFGQSKHTWQDGSSMSDYIVTEAGTYYVTIENRCDTASDTVNILTKNCNCILYIPSAFSPNGKGPGENETWRPTVCDVTSYNMKVFTRWGELIFETDNINQGWDGKYGQTEVPSGVYVYIIQYKQVGERKKQAQGTIMLLR